MKFNDFLKINQNSPIIDSSIFSLYNEKPQNIRRQVHDWIKKNYLISLKKGLYIFDERFRKIQPSTFFIANFLYFPSYISLESALQFYNLIPEKVTVITSVTTKKTNIFKNALGTFEYRSVNETIFMDFKRERE